MMSFWKGMEWTWLLKGGRPWASWKTDAYWWRKVAKFGGECDNSFKVFGKGSHEG